MEKLNRLRDSILHTPPAGVISYKKFYRNIKVVGDKKRRFFMTITTNNNLADLSLIVSKRYYRLRDLRVGVFSFPMGNSDLLPSLDFSRLAYCPWQWS